MRSTIICVDDEKMMLRILTEQMEQWFGTRYYIEKANCGESALKVVDECIKKNREISLIISDYIMPNMRGDELFRHVTERDPRIRKIMLTGYSSIEGIVNAINHGGLYRYITKPWDANDLMLTTVEAIRSYEAEQKNADLARGFESMYKKYEKLYLESQDDLDKMITSMHRLSTLRDPARAGHAEATAAYLAALAKQLEYDEPQKRMFKHMAWLHDIGMTALTDIEIAILKRADDNEKLSEPARQIILKLIRITDNILTEMSISDVVKRGVVNRFEHWDGRGPQGLAHEEIPVEAAMLSLACFYAEKKAILLRNQAYTKDAALRLMNNVINRRYASQLVLAFVDVIKNEFAKAAAEQKWSTV